MHVLMETILPWLRAIGMQLCCRLTGGIKVHITPPPLTLTTGDLYTRPGLAIYPGPGMMGLQTGDPLTTQSAAIPQAG